MKTAELCARWGLTEQEVEDLRASVGGRFITTVKDGAGNIKFVGSDKNIVTNEGLNHILDTELSGGTQITTWRVALSKSTHAAAAGMTYASPTFTEVASNNVTETIRQAWTDGGVSSQSVDNSTSQATYTCSTNTFTAYGAGLVGGSGTTVIANTTNAGTLYAYSKFASSKAMSATDTIDITYTFTAADDGV